MWSSWPEVSSQSSQLPNAAFRASPINRAEAHARPHVLAPNLKQGTILSRYSGHRRINEKHKTCKYYMRQRSLGSEVAVRLLEAGGSMSDHIHDSSSAVPSEQLHRFAYPWAAPPDIIRANQKDAYFQSILLNHLSSVVRSLYGARTAQTWSSEARTLTEVLYLALTTLVANRTLGEEYCDIVQIEADSLQLPSLARRSGYIVSSVLLPYILGRILPAVRRRIRARLEANQRKAARQRILSPTSQTSERKQHVQAYLLRHLDTLTSPTPLYAASLTIFYFTGAYYQLGKRAFGLRYVFTRKLSESDSRAGYEVLGVLLLLQLAVQGWMHVQDTLAATASRSEDDLASASAVSHSAMDPAVRRERLAEVTHTPLPTETASGAIARHDLADPTCLPWIIGRQQRRCTLCLEGLKDPSATTCGHVFCWSCLTEWLREQPMCPLCRQSALPQHVLPLRG